MTDVYFRTIQDSLFFDNTISEIVLKFSCLYDIRTKKGSEDIARESIELIKDVIVKGFLPCSLVPYILEEEKAPSQAPTLPQIEEISAVPVLSTATEEIPVVWSVEQVAVFDAIVDDIPNIFSWSKEQVAIFNAMTNEMQNIIVRARAGCGKTTTASEGIKRYGKSVV